MRKNISSLLQRGNLTPKERVLLLVANQVSKEKDGKSILTEADEYALGEGWTPANNEEVKEYNRYHGGWICIGLAELDAQRIFLNAKNNFLRVNSDIKLIDSGLLIEKELNELVGKKFDKKLSEGWLLLTKKVEELSIDIDEKEALELIIKNSGLELDKVIYTYAFESLSEDLKKDILALALDPDTKDELTKEAKEKLADLIIDTLIQHFDQEEIIVNLFKGKDELTKEAKEKLADLIVDFLYLDIERLEEGKRWVFNSYFAGLPALDILKKWADYNENYTKKEIEELEKKGDEAIEKELTQKLKDYAEKNKKGIRDLLKETILKWLDEGLFIKEYAPIFNSDEKKTYGGKTKLPPFCPYKKVFKKWRLAKLGAKVKIQELIDKGELKVWELLDIKKPLKIITGESLYNLKGDFTFAKDFKKQADALKGLGYLILLLRKCRFMKNYAILLAFKELFKKLSKIYEIDLTYKIDKWIEDLKSDIEQLNYELILISEKLEEVVYLKHNINITFLKETLIKDILIDLDKVKSSKERQEGGLYVAGIGRYYQEFEKLFDEEF